MFDRSVEAYFLNDSVAIDQFECANTENIHTKHERLLPCFFVVLLNMFSSLVASIEMIHRIKSHESTLNKMTKLRLCCFRGALAIPILREKSLFLTQN